MALDERMESLKQNPRGEFLQAINDKDMARCLVKTAEIHGHFCPGSALGVMASVYGLNMLGLESISSDGLEDLMAVVEINACFADGVQAVSGCTLGNNALVYRDLGRLAVTFAMRGKETGIRVRVKPDFRSFVAQAAPEFFPLMEKVIKNREGGIEEKAAFRKVGREAAFALIRLPFEELFEIETIEPHLPEYAPIAESIVCANCGEMIMTTKAVDGLCLLCAGEEYRQVEGRGIVANGQCDVQNRHKKGKSSFWMQDPELVFRVLDLKEGDCFLDLGCGPGDYSLRASELLGDSGMVYALDRNHDAIADLRDKAVSAGSKNIKAEVCDISAPLPVKDSSVDICFISTVLHSLNLTDVEKTLFGEIKRVLKPSGRLAIIECKKEAQPFGPPIDMRISAEDLERTITKYGFTIVSLSDLGYNYLIQFRRIPEDLADPFGQKHTDIVLHPVGVIKSKIEKPF